MTKRTYEKALRELPAWARTVLADNRRLYWATNYHHKSDNISRNYVSDSLWVLSDLGCDMQGVRTVDNVFMYWLSSQKKDWDILVRMMKRDYNQPQNQMQELFDELLDHPEDAVVGDIVLHE